MSHYGKLASITAALIVFHAGSVLAGGETAEYIKEVKAFHAERAVRWAGPSGYLPIIGLQWLEDGETTFGTGETNDFVIETNNAPERIGTFVRADGKVSFSAASGVAVTHDGQPVATLALRDDHDEDGPTVLELGTLSWYVIKRSNRLGVRVKDTERSEHYEFAKPDLFPIDRAWRIEATFKPYPAPVFIDVPTEYGGIEKTPSPGQVVFEKDGKSYSMTVFEEPSYSDPETIQYWVILGDGTSGHETYPGGRFLYFGTEDENGKVILDFNKAYSPPCAFSEYTTCPLPPPECRIDLRVTAGEKYDHSSAKKLIVEKTER